MSVSLEQLRELTIGLLPRLRRFAHAISEAAHSADDLVLLCVERTLLERSQECSGQELESELFSRLARECAAGNGSVATTTTAQEQQPESLVLRRAYAGLPLQQRIAIALVVLEQRSYRDTAAVLELSLPTLTQQLWRGRELLRSQLPR